MTNALKSKIAKAGLGLVAAASLLIGAVSVSAYTFNTNLKLGMKGNADVVELQKALGVTPSSGYFGPLTLAAVKAYQTSHGLPSTGFVGPLTRTALNAGGTTTTGTLPDGCTSTTGFSPTTGQSCATGTTVVSTGPVSVSLGSATMTDSFIAPATGVEFAKFNFSGNGAVTMVKLMRKGISSSTTLNNVYLYDGATRLTDGASVGSDNMVTFNSPTGLFTVAGSKTITVVADTASADYSLGFTLVSFTSGGTTTTANLAASDKYGASATLATVAMSSASGSGNTDAGNDINVWQGTATVSTRDVILKSLALRQIGSIYSNDIKNFKLYVDGVMAGSAVASLDSNGYVTFTPSVALKTGARILKVTADVIGGAGRTVQMSLRGTYDLQTTDTQYNANGTATGTYPFGPSAFTVNSGTLTVVKATDSPSSNVTIGASAQPLAKYTFTAYGEAVKVETLRVGMITTGGTVTDNTIRNVRIHVNGSQVGSNTSVPAAASFAAATGTAFTTNFIVYPGTPTTVEILADIYDNESTDDIAAGTTTAIQALLVGGTSTSNGIPQVSLGTINVPTSTNVLGNNLTITSGVMTVAKNLSYANKTIAVPQTAYKVGSFTLSGNATEPVNLNTIYVGFADTSSDAAPATDLSDLYVVYGGTMTPVKGTVTCTYSSGCTNANSWSISKTLGVNETVAFDVYATIASSLSTNSFITTLAVAGTTANSGIATYADASGTTSLSAGVSGQEITGGSGSITVSKDASSSASQLVDDSGTFKSLSAKFAAVTDTYTVTDITVTLPSGGAGAVSSVTLKNQATGEVVGASKPAAATMTWSGLNMTVDAGTSKILDVELTLSPVGVGAGTTDSSLATVISTFTARDSAGTSATGTGTATGNTSYVYKAVPLVSQVSLSNTTLAATTMTLAKFTVSSNGTGTIAWKQTMLELTKTAWPILATPTLWNADTGEQITAAVVFQNDTNTDAACNASDTACEILITVGTNADDDTVEQISGAKTYEVRSAITGTQAAGVISVTLDRNTTTHAASAAEQTNDNATTANGVSFVWSDESASATSDTGVSTWQKDFLVKTLPMTWTLTRS